MDMQDLLRDMLTWVAKFVGISLAIVIGINLVLRWLSRRKPPQS